MKTKALVLLTVIATIASACETGSSPPQPTILIASDFPGPFTVALRQAIQLAVAQHSQIGTLRLSYLPLDDSLGGFASAALGVQNVKHMIADPSVMGMIGPFNSYVIRDEIPRANKFDLVMLSPSSTDACLTRPPFCNAQLRALHASRPTNFFRIAAPDYHQGTGMARLTASLHIKRVAAFNEWGDDGNLLLDHFTTELDLRGGSVVLRQDLPSTTSAFSDFLAKAKASNAEAIYAVGDTNTSNAICAVARQMKRDFAYFFVTDGLTGNDGCVPADAKTYGTYVDVDPTNSTNPAAIDAVRAYRKAYPHTKQIADYTFAAYDCALILIDAITRVVQANGGGAPTRAQVLAAVAHGQFSDGVTGSYSFDMNGDAVSPMMAVWQVENGHWAYLKQIDVGPKSN